MFLQKTTAADSLTKRLSATETSITPNVISVSYDAGKAVLLINWEGEPGSCEIRESYNRVMEEVRAHKPRKLLLDVHKRGVISRSDQRWVFSYVFPQVLRIVGDNVFVAIVLPVSLYSGLVAEMDGDELMHENNFLIIHHSLYREDAYRWLGSI